MLHNIKESVVQKFLSLGFRAVLAGNVLQTGASDSVYLEEALGPKIEMNLCLTFVVDASSLEAFVMEYIQESGIDALLAGKLCEQ